MHGRIGDTPLIGCGGYANEYGGCSTTGHGESLMKMALAREAVYNIEKGNNAQVIANDKLNYISQFLTQFPFL
jgi:beta-aspartyl-peptidase (threonine type)